MAAARCVARGLWRNQVLSARISTRLTVQPASLFSSESGKILRRCRTFRILKTALDQPYCPWSDPLKTTCTLKNLSTFKSPGVCVWLQEMIWTSYHHAPKKEGRKLTVSCVMLEFAQVVLHIFLIKGPYMGLKGQQVFISVVSLRLKNVSLPCVCLL